MAATVAGRGRGYQANRRGRVEVFRLVNVVLCKCICCFVTFVNKRDVVVLCQVVNDIFLMPRLLTTLLLLKILVSILQGTTMMVW